MNIHKRQIIAVLQNKGVVIQFGGMLVMTGDIQASSIVKDAGDMLRKLSSVTAGNGGFGNTILVVSR